MDSYYQSRIASVLNGKVHVHKSSRYLAPNPGKLEPLSSDRQSENVFSVHNAKSKQTYVVDMEVEECTCPQGSSGAPCKHQYFVAKEHQLSSQQFHDTVGPEDKVLLHKIMVGSVELPSEEWYMGIHDKPNVIADQTVSAAAESLHDASVVTVTSQSDGGNDKAAEADVGNDKAAEVRGNDKTTEVDAGNVEAIEDSNLEYSDGSDQQEVDKWSTELLSMCQDLSGRLKRRPDVYLSGVKAMVTAYKKVCREKSENAVGSVLHSMKGLLRTGKSIPVQPTAVARRTVHLGGRKLQQTGRPPKAARVAEHGYGKQKRSASGPTPIPKARHAAPHSISRRVDALRVLINIFGNAPQKFVFCTLPLSTYLSISCVSATLK